VSMGPLSANAVSTHAASSRGRSPGQPTGDTSNPEHRGSQPTGAAGLSPPCIRGTSCASTTSSLGERACYARAR
jgi:hypothetical protein